MQTQSTKDKLANLTVAGKKFINNETYYSLKKNLLELCSQHSITPQELFAFIETIDLEKEETPQGEKETLPHLNTDEDETEEGGSIQAAEIENLAEVVDELPPEERQYPPGWTS